MINVGAVSDFFRTCDAVSVAVHRLSGNQTEQTMRKFYLISLAAAAALSLTGCLKSEGNDLFKKLEPVRPGIAIYNAAHPQNVLSMQSADAALRLAMLLAEAEKQAAAAVEQGQEPGDPFDVEYLKKIQVSGANLQNLLFGYNTELEKIASGFRIRYNGSKGSYDAYNRTGSYIVMTGDRQLAATDADNLWTVSIDTPVEMTAGSDEKVTCEGGSTRIHADATGGYVIEMAAVKIYEQEAYTSDWSGTFRWKPKAGTLCYSDFAEEGKGSELEGEASGRSFVTFNNTTSLALEYEIKGGECIGYNIISDGVETCRMPDAGDYDAAQFPSNEVLVEWELHGSYALIYTIRYNGYVVVVD